jgi:SAM-dependent methyltransferase
MIVSVANEGPYLEQYTCYCLRSAYRSNPDRPFHMFLVNHTGAYDELLKDMHPDVVIRNLPLDLHPDFADTPHKVGYAFKSLTLSLALDKADQPVIFVDGDILIRGSLDPLYEQLKRADLSVRYLPHLVRQGLLSKNHGTRVNTGVIGLAPTSPARAFAADLYQRTADWLATGKPAGGFDNKWKVNVGIDQEFFFLVLQDHRGDLVFEPMNDAFNDAYYMPDSPIWHAKGVGRCDYRYQSACRSLIDDRSLSAGILKLKAAERSAKDWVKRLIHDETDLLVPGLDLILRDLALKRVLVLGSGLFRDNADTLGQLIQEAAVSCIDTDPAAYYLNKDKVATRGSRVEHRFLDIHDPDQTQKLTRDAWDLTIAEKKEALTDLGLDQHIPCVVRDGCTNQPEINNVKPAGLSLGSGFVFYHPDQPATADIRSQLTSRPEQFSAYIHPAWTYKLRKAELSLIQAKLEPGQRILEVGSGDGFLASELQSQGFNVTPSDPAPRSPAYTEVMAVDDLEKHFAAGSFDHIISSHVLEHVTNLDATLKGYHRLLSSNGLMTHTMPTPGIMALTMLLQPLAYLRSLKLLWQGIYFQNLKKPIFRNKLRKLRIIIGKLNPLHIVISPGHGWAGPIQALRQWRGKAWQEVFERNGFVLLGMEYAPFAASQHKLFPNRAMKLRRWLSGLGIASARVHYPTKKA